ncbi:MAG TPA: hypothetical protein VFF73_37140 [Planctomycetota bacterium]|nr:hypothetical protein [Planctomycetota bacterium]
MRRIATANVALHVLGLALGATLMRPGSIAEPLEARWQFLAERHSGWALGWAVWFLSALTFVAFMERLVRRVPEARLALVLGAMGASVDLVGDSVQGLVLPLVAASTPEPNALFLTVERAANVAGLVVANGLYSVAVLVATVQLRGKSLAAAGSLTFVAGMVMVAGGLADSAQLVVISAGPTIVGYVAWVLLAARDAKPE